MESSFLSYKRWLLLVGFTLWVISLGVGHYIYIDILIRVPPNVFINEVDIGGLNYEDLENMLEDLEEKMLEKDVIIQYISTEEEHYFHYPLSSFGFTTNRIEVKEQVRSLLDLSASMYTNLSQYKTIKEEGKIISMHYEQDLIYNHFLNILKDFEEIQLKDPIDAFYYYEDGEIKIQPDVEGEKFDYEELFKVLRELNVDDEMMLQMSVTTDKSEITEEILRNIGIEKIISSFSTSFSTSNVPRTTNIRIATDAIDGLLLAPNQQFSFNEVVGERTVQQGYQPAGVFINGRLASGIGGGICQVSSTLYNTALNAGLEILERHPHSLPVSYVARGRDAAISWGLLDLRFRNNTDHYIYIHGRVQGSRVFFEFFGPDINKI
ncbi:MAG: VanW family protein [Clostridiaceae bacterium]|nr:VanW family protein [Clostridiaceae bacterium]